ncbi:MAG: hypothetical protein JW995_04350 [Melioribacteraceae bacterium]|nr:hypothetical protein [Melioribacteraceae bacterium]
MSKKIHVSLSLVSAALISFQIVLMQILSITQWHHFAFMIISLALLGFGSAGTFISLYRDWLIERKETIIPASIIISGIFTVISIPLSQLNIFRFDTLLIFTDNSHLIKLMFTYFLLLLPFFTGAVSIGLIFVSYSGEISRLYFSNMLGSGLGGIFAILLLTIFKPQSAPVVLSVLYLFAGIVYQKSSNKKIITILEFSLLIIIITGWLVEFDFKISQYKDLSKTLNLPDAEIIAEKNSPYGFIQVAESDALRYAPGLSLNFRGNVPVHKAVFNNGDWVGAVISCDFSDTNSVFDFTTEALVYKLIKPENVLVLNAGTGENVIHASKYNPDNITAVEPNRALNYLMKYRLADDNDSVYYSDKIDLVELSPRTFLQKQLGNYDIIKLPMLGTFGGSAGLQAINEQYLLTSDSFELMFDRLTDRGFISITSWLDYPFRNPLRLLSTIIKGLQMKGIGEPQSHIISVKSWSTISFLVKKNRIRYTDIAAVREFCAKMSFDPVILPGIRPEERIRYNRIQDNGLFNFIDSLLSDNRQELINNYAFRINAPSDDQPFFSQFLKWNNLSEIGEYFGSNSVPFFELGYLIVILTFTQILIISLLLIILPLFRLGLTGEKKLQTFIYFTGLGVGYMFVEIVLIQKFILYFGNPVYAASAVISFMLICSGIGSYFSRSVPVNRIGLRIVLAAIILLILIYALMLDLLLKSTIHFEEIWKIILSFLIIGIPAFLMGFPFPLGIQKLDRSYREQIPWAWGINSCFSVISTALATLLSVELGFTAVLLLSMLAYGMTAGVTLFYREIKL